MPESVQDTNERVAVVCSRFQPVLAVGKSDHDDCISVGKSDYNDYSAPDISAAYGPLDNQYFGPGSFVMVFPYNPPVN